MSKSKFNGKIALISGAGSGIGLELAKRLGEKGATIVGTDIDAGRAENLVQTLKDKGVTAYGYQVDHTNLSAVEALKETVNSDVGPVDIICCNAGVAHGGRIEKIPLKDWQWVMDINFWGVVYMLRLFIPDMIQRKQGWVMITSSGAGLYQGAGMAPYNASKAAVLGISNTLRSELKEHNIVVTALCPGVINTNLVKDGKMSVSDKSFKAAISHYKEKGTHPSVVAKDAVRALEKNIGIMATPLHVWPLYLLNRLSPELLFRVAGHLAKKGRNFVSSLD